MLDNFSVGHPLENDRRFPCQDFQLLVNLFCNSIFTSKKQSLKGNSPNHCTRSEGRHLPPLRGELDHRAACRLLARENDEPISPLLPTGHEHDFEHPSPFRTKNITKLLPKREQLLQQGRFAQTKAPSLAAKQWPFGDGHGRTGRAADFAAKATDELRDSSVAMP
ncbi:hypothetical protein CEXT_718081 [Caerostris extrusa]|uniref:Uncharacterized protein n=1 Tax=Caerostris extrusa TaxID=172846 RepID=A0AAV4XST9_CAEEX|nr:hypothetical protein CEXT_718081 [Caerostris extrusa]